MRALWHDCRANITLMTAISAPVLIGFVAFAVDTGTMYVDRRAAQAVTDLAALAAASDPVNAALLAKRTVEINRFKVIAPVEIQTGRYVADASLKPTQRFTPTAAAQADAVRVTLRSTTPSYFSRIIGAADKFQITTTATAAMSQTATFAIGSRLASLNGGVINQLLGRAFGGSISLSVMDYRALSDLHVSAFGFLDSLATEARLTGPTYGSVLRSDVRPAAIIRALSASAAKQGRLSSSMAQALRSLALLAAQTNTPVNFGSEINIGAYDKLKLGSKPPTGASLSVLQAVMATARLADGTNQVAGNLSINLAPVASAAFALTVGERPASSVWNRTGPIGSKVETAQTRLGVRFKMAAPGLAIDLPIYVDVAHSVARLADVGCPKRPNEAVATLEVKPGVAQAWIATIPEGRWRSLQPVNTPQDAPIAAFGPLSVTAKAHVNMAAGGWVVKNFTGREIDAFVAKTATGDRYVSSLTESLLDDLRLGVSGVDVTTLQTQAIRDTIRAAAAPIDSTIDSLLAYLGVRLGQADVTVTDIRCDGGVLVN